MSFSPIIPAQGLAGWAFLTRTRARQEQSFAKTPIVARDVSHFRAKFAQVETPEALVSDRRLLRVALGAFGLQEDLDNRAFIRKLLEDGTTDRRSLANRLADKRYLAFVTSFAHLTPGSTTGPATDLTERIVTQYQSRAFEIAVGDQDQTMRLGLSLQRELPQLVDQYTSEDARWFGALGNPPLRAILETTLGLPREFGQLDLDDQVRRMRSAMQRRFGTSRIDELAQPETLAKLTTRFQVMSQLRESQSVISGAATALTLLQNMRR
jgi:hypothetical protein